jgi:hypothetical protein
MAGSGHGGEWHAAGCQLRHLQLSVVLAMPVLFTAIIPAASMARDRECGFPREASRQSAGLDHDSQVPR